MSVAEGLRKYKSAAKESSKTKVSSAKVAAKPAAKAAAPAKPVEKVADKTAEKNADKTSKSAKPDLKTAIQEQVKASEAIQEEIELQESVKKELEEIDKKTSKLVRGDLSPANTKRDLLIMEYASLIKYIAQRIAARLPANIELDDLISSGVIGLMDAIDKFDETRDNKFKTYAEFRIRGAILDELRAQDWVPRSVREKAKQLERVYLKIEQEKGRHATDDEVCDELKLSKEEYHDLLNQVRSVSILSFDDIATLSKADKQALNQQSEESSKTTNPYSEVNVAAMKRMISDAIRDLPEKQRLVLSLYYYEDLNLKEIGRVLDVTESRVSQLHTQAIIRLKGKLGTHFEELLTLLT